MGASNLVSFPNTRIDRLVNPESDTYYVESVSMIQKRAREQEVDTKNAKKVGSFPVSTRQALKRTIEDQETDCRQYKRHEEHCLFFYQKIIQKLFYWILA